MKIICLFLCLLPMLANAQLTCEAASLPTLPDVKITSVEPIETPVNHCKVLGVIGTEIQIELLLPADWNGKFVMGGGGGFVGALNNQALGQGVLESGYATVTTDTGHQANGIIAAWALNNLERIVNYGHSAVHRTAVDSKALITGFYGEEIKRNYFFGCSNGGRQALMEAQRYPEDFEGIISGAPAYNFTGVAAHFISTQQAMFPDPDNLSEALISTSESALLEEAILSQCDALDGLEDGILNDPRQCIFNLDSLPACSSIDNDECFSEAEISAIRTVYNGPQDSRGNKLSYGFPYGGESDSGGWNAWVTGGVSDEGELPIPNAHYGFGTQGGKYLVLHDENWDYSTYNLDSFEYDTRTIAQTIDASDPDLSSFRNNGGKLLMYHGWSDPALSALATIGYYQDVLETDSRAYDDVRLFMLPGVLHCAGGKGPSSVRYIDALDNWVESGIAPDTLNASFIDQDGKLSGSRPLCAYPEVAVYDGVGSDRDANSFSCLAP